MISTAFTFAQVEMPLVLKSRYIKYVPAVFVPSEVGVNWKISSSAPDTPVTLKLPSVDSSSFPVDVTASASTSSLGVVRPASLPSK